MTLISSCRGIDWCRVLVVKIHYLTYNLALYRRFFHTFTTSCMQQKAMVMPIMPRPRYSPYNFELRAIDRLTTCSETHLSREHADGNALPKSDADRKVCKGYQRCALTIPNSRRMCLFSKNGGNGINRIACSRVPKNTPGM